MVNQKIISEIRLTVFSDIKYLDVVQCVADGFFDLVGFEGSFGVQCGQT